MACMTCHCRRAHLGLISLRPPASPDDLVACLRCVCLRAQVATYRLVLQTADQQRATVRTDPLQLLHTKHNLLEVLGRCGQRGAGGRTAPALSVFRCAKARRGWAARVGAPMFGLPRPDGSLPSDDCPPRISWPASLSSRAARPCAGIAVIRTLRDERLSTDVRELRDDYLAQRQADLMTKDREYG